MDLRKEAKYYLQKGFSVIPVGKNKIPLINWKEYQERFPTEEEIDKWFDEFPDAQIGAVTGKISGIVVIDVEKGGDISWIPETATSKTGGGGYHFFYKFSKPFKNKTRIKELTDIRGNGGYVIMPPSVSEKGEYKWIKKVALQMFPYWLFEDEKEEKKYSQTFDSEYEGVNEGGRNDAIARYAGHLVAKIHPTEWEKIALPLLMEANQKNDPPLPDHEVKAIFDSITSIEKSADNDRWYKKQEEVPEDSDVMPFFSAAENDESAKLEKYSTGFGIFDSALDGGMAEGDLVVISGSTGHGKTETTLTLTYNFAEQGIPVLYFSYEVLIGYLLEKFKKMGASEDMPIYCPQKIITGNISWVEKKILESKEKYGIKVVVVDHLGFLMPKVKMSDMSGGNYATYITQMVRELKQIAVRERIIIILPVHMRKTIDEPSVNDLKDSSGIGQEADEVFIIIREKNNDPDSTNYYTNHSKIKLEKNRKTGQSVQGWFTLINGRFVHDEFYKKK